MDLFTIGHSTYEIETFISLLKKHEINAVADVRSHPYSRFMPHFNRNFLKELLAKENIYYVFLGKELGARTDDLRCYIDGRALYENIAATAQFQKGIERLLKGLQKHRISLMCAEKDPITCHRAILVCQHVRHPDLNINHILKGGELESHIQLEERMLNKHGLIEFTEDREEQLQLSLFEQPKSRLPTKEESLKKAYQLQGYEIAYVDKNYNNHGRTDRAIHNRVYPEKRSKVL
ncbi:DUF488 family protein [Chamaesiphon minutus]|uniref:DUF488 domain-containing protein n=1 Tax=Chamaesiphon minutus (strain ATCC 27169 / PCC 6605) TaxID=1173020 RepID=K9UAT6_CHAP6|nr:DUF488 domain-containing protein [Chamaesiphon minutus]AFY91955.1 hypothetical protein Cha6605_0683 [Chamaesiphon minutus PCC 6605]